VDESRPKTPTAPAVGRTPTAEELARAINRLNESLNKRLEHVERAADSDLLPFIRETGARYTEVASGLTGLSERVIALTSTIDQWREDIRRDIEDHDARLLTVEERGTEHHVRLDTLDEQQLDSRVRVLEQHQAGDARELSLTRSQKRRFDARVGVISTLVSGLAALLNHLLGG
jgi:exonuclease VII large subunit